MYKIYSTLPFYFQAEQTSYLLAIAGVIGTGILILVTYSVCWIRQHNYKKGQDNQNSLELQKLTI